MAFKVSKLTLDSHLVLPPEECDYFGPSEGFPFWRVFIDDELISDTVQPFDSADHLIEVYGNTTQHIWMDGHGKVSVRRAGSYILWSRPIGLSAYSAPDDITDYMLHWSAIPHNQIYVFSLDQYLSVVNEHFAKTEPTYLSAYAELDPKNYLNPKFNRRIQDSYLRQYYDALKLTPEEHKPPKLTSPELRELLEALLVPVSEESIHIVSERRPFSILDCDGNKLRPALVKTLLNYSVVEVVEPPSKFIDFLLILNLSTNGPSIFRVGYTPEGKIAILFTSNPSFPLWLSGEGFDELFRDEEALAALR